jgi:hypothetical protein
MEMHIKLQVLLTVALNEGDIELITVLSKLSPCLFFNWAPRHKGILGECKYSSTRSLTSALDGG